MRKIFVVIVLVAGACTDVAISDIGTDKVKVQGRTAQRDKVNTEAARGCALYNRSPTYLSERCVDTYCTVKEFLFACRQS